jgi:hypothetical protein
VILQSDGAGQGTPSNTGTQQGYEFPN